MIHSVSLHVLDLGHVRGEDVPIPGYVIGMSDGRHVLVDTGCPRAMIDVQDAVFVVDSEHHVSGQLARLGLRCSDIFMVVVTHLDPDHCGANEEFAHAELVVQQAQYQHATTSGEHRYEWLRQHWDRPDLCYRLVDGDHELLPGVQAIETGGHVPGHQSVLVMLPRSGPVLLAGDAWMRGTEAATRPVTPFDLDEPATRRSQAKLEALTTTLGVNLVIHNHDPGQWTELRKSPHAYH